MRTIGETIKLLREERRMSQQSLADALNTSRSTISMYESGSRIPNDEMKEYICDYFNVDLNYLFGKTNTRNSYRENVETTQTQFNNVYNVNKIKLPLLGSIACGKPIYAEEDRESYIMVGTEVHADFCLRCKGDSMINARIHDGDIVFIRKQDIVNNGEIAAVIIDDEATLKRFYYYKEQNMVILKPENSKYQDIILINEKLNSIRILGKAVAFQSDVK